MRHFILFLLICLSTVFNAFSEDVQSISITNSIASTNNADTITIVKHDTIFINNCDKITEEVNETIDCGDFYKLPEYAGDSLYFIFDTPTCTSGYLKVINKSHKDYAFAFYDVNRYSYESVTAIYLIPADTSIRYTICPNFYSSYKNLRSLNVFLYNDIQIIDFVNPYTYWSTVDADGYGYGFSFKVNGDWYSIAYNNLDKIAIPMCADSVKIGSIYGSHNDYFGDMELSNYSKMSIEEFYKHLYKGKLVISKTKINLPKQSSYHNDLDECSSNNEELTNENELLTDSVANLKNTIIDLQNEIDALHDEIIKADAETINADVIKPLPKRYVDALGREIYNVEEYKGVAIPIYK